ncbi:MAG: DsbA family protein [Caldilineae bacterium]|nr:DsbA family protein [Chloroflexota bacterium]MCB9175640.1 DsbA family protein [Caldilineae bacterium]
MSRSKPVKAASRGAGKDSAIVIGPGLLLGFLALVLLAGGTTWLLIARERGLAPMAGAVGTAATALPVDAAPADNVAITPADPVSGGSVEPGTGVTPEGDPFIGAADAPVTIVEFSDYQCPNCRQFATVVLPWLKQTWLAQGFVRVVFRDFAIRGDRSIDAARAAHCAGEQGRFWSYHDAVFAMAGGTSAQPLDPENLERLAGEEGLDPEAFGSCFRSGRHRDRIDASAAFAYAQGFEGTPTYLINGRKTQGAIEIADWDRLFRLYQQDLGQGATP